MEKDLISTWLKKQGFPVSFIDAEQNKIKKFPQTFRNG